MSTFLPYVPTLCRCAPSENDSRFLTRKVAPSRGSLRYNLQSALLRRSKFPPFSGARRPWLPWDANRTVPTSEHLCPPPERSPNDASARVRHRNVRRRLTAVLAGAAVCVRRVFVRSFVAGYSSEPAQSEESTSCPTRPSRPRHTGASPVT